jgi:hypothetical protein
MIVRVSDPANQHIKVRIAGDSGNGYYQNDDSFHITFDLSSKTVVYAGSKAGTAEIKELSAKVFRITLNQTYTASTAFVAAGWAFRLSDQSDASDYNTPQVPQGSWFEFTACQREELVGFPTSYIPTAGTQVTRAADNCVRVLGDEFNNDSFTVYAEFTSSGLPGTGIFEMHNGDEEDRVGVSFDSSAELQAFVVKNNSVTALLVKEAGISSAKVAVSFSGVAMVFVVDGTVVSTTTYAGNPDLSFLDVATYRNENSGAELNGSIKDFQIFPTALSEAELITLTGGN